MKAYKVISGVLQVGGGVSLGLSASQASARTGSITPIEGRRGVYQASAPLQFITGELIGLDDLENSVGLAQVSKLSDADDADMRAAEEQEQAAAAQARKAKGAARERARSLNEKLTAIGNAREEGRKSGYAEGFRAGEARGSDAAYKRGFEDGKAAAIAEARAAEEAGWAAAYAGSDELKAQFETVDAYIAERRSAA